jgi:hypothetical protein
MRRYVIVPVVEGFGEVAAVPVLIRRWLQHQNFHRNVDLHLAGPVRASGVGALTVPHNQDDELGIEHYVQMAWLRRPDIILVVLDADEECPRTLGPALLARGMAIVPNGFPLGLVIAKREYEAWFLAALTSTRFRNALQKQGFTLDQRFLPGAVDIEEIADCKDRVARLLSLKKYEPTIHQEKLTRILPFTAGMQKRSRSFRKLLKELDSLMIQARQFQAGSAPEAERE